ncbi:DUF2092 domain-containing protein [Variovorax sp. J22P240]|uniref:DUF2092 domain-containing protein n=1 Tax=unclassified Variovorax TaxID=663243 RepID=UPI002575FAC7|nr:MULTISPECIES: DUF2092 domain-containing protein [unclassified Variovorax]MDM0001657.1 DUF2092 domain-containing protein [Variovorax sp. J22P240]MDM0053436.1 DUF2092 domain-containing protein [Variovorax sp. J22R115]
MKCRFQLLAQALLFAASVTFVIGAHAQATPAKASAPKSKAASAAPQLEAKVMELLRAMSGALTASSSMAFTAVATYESPSTVGPPLAFTTTSEVLMQRPNKLRVITSGDGGASEYFFDGKTLTAFAPSENLVAVAPAPPTIDAMLEMAFKDAAIYFPFADLLGADPFRNIAEGLTKAFYVGPSTSVGGTTTDVVAVVSDELFMQIWIGAEDKLPRRLRATYRGDPLLLRHQVDLSNWKLDPVVAAEAFASVNAANARRIPFAAPRVPPATGKARSGKPRNAP